MEIPAYQPFYIETLEALRAEILRIGLELPATEDLQVLARPLQLGAKQLGNRFCSQPITGCDADANGAPGELTFRRYLACANGGFGLIWLESTMVGSASAPHRLRLNEGNLEAFKSLVDAIRGVSNAVLIVQLALPAADPKRELADEEIDCCREELIHAAELAAAAGFDGVDIQCSHGTLPAFLLGAIARPGRYGGSIENRSRFLCETVQGIKARVPGLVIATRLCAFEAIKNGFGVSPADYRKPDLTEPIRLVQLLQTIGVSILNVTAKSPNLRGTATERPLRAREDAEEPDEHPLMTLERQFYLARKLREAAPGMVIVGSGLSWVRQFAPHIAAGAIEQGWLDLAGFGRGALAFPGAPGAIISHGSLEPGASCMRCFACSLLFSENQPVGCVIRDGVTYGPVYRQMRRFDPDQLIAGARRCHLCEAAPCVAANPTRGDIPGFIQAFLKGDESRAYEIIRRSDPLPELTSQVSPAWLQSEGACVETTLTGSPVPILDLQYSISWRARDRGESGIRLPGKSSGKRVAVVGGGPAGIAAATRLLERGHAVDLFEHSDCLGGMPQRVIPSCRLPDITAEITALIEPALTASRLQIHYGSTLGQNLALTDLRAKFDAVLLAIGLWKEQSIGRANGVMDALSFLEEAKRGALRSVPERVALLAGGDSAMDAGRTLQRLGAKEVFVVFSGPRSAMHWHMPESWFATPGVHAMMNWEPVGFECNHDGQLCAVRLRHSELKAESLLPVSLAIEAMGLQLAVPQALAPMKGVYLAGAMLNGGASVAQCISEGIAAAETIHSNLT